MRVVVRSVGALLMGVVAAVLFGLSSTMTTVVAMTAATALIMGGTQHPLMNPPDNQQFVAGYLNGANDNYISPTGLCGAGAAQCTLVAVVTPEQFVPVYGTMTFDQSVAAGQQNLDSCLHGTACTHTNPATGTTSDVAVTNPDGYVVYGYSQSATIASLEKAGLAGETNPPKNVLFVLIADPNRPNGGILERFNGVTIPILGVTFSGAAPTDTTMATVDVAQQYDGWADFPTNPLNLLADVNAALGISYLHGNYFGVSTAPQLQGQYGDTTYYLIPTPTLPMLMPLDSIPTVGPILADTLDPVLRVLVEAGYDRTVNPGQPTPANFLYFPNPLSVATNVVLAIPVGLDNGIFDVTGTRPLGTKPEGTYGVGGPAVDTGAVEPIGPPTPLPTAPPAASSTVQATVTNTQTQTQTPQSKAATTPPAIDVNAKTNTPTLPQSTPGPSTPPATKPHLPGILRGPIGSDSAASKNLTPPSIKTALSGLTNGPNGAAASQSETSGNTGSGKSK